VSVAVFGYAVGSVSERKATQSFKYRNFVMAEYSNQHFKDETVLAMGDQAGSFGYFSRHSVVHLEGLVNNYEIVPHIKNDDLDSYISNNRIDYVVAAANVSGNYKTARISTTHKQKIRTTNITVYSSCEVYQDEVGIFHRFIWKWECAHNPSVEPAPATRAR
jgi:hypothetical protein